MTKTKQRFTRYLILPFLQQWPIALAKRLVKKNPCLNKCLLGTLLALLPALSDATFCPTNFSQIQVGDSTDQVQKQCGKPDKQETIEETASTPQEWNYYIPQTVSIGTPTEQQGTLKTTVAFNSEGKVININVNGIGIGASTICGPTIQLGDTEKAVKAACGTASFIAKQDPATAGPSAPPTTLTTFTYGTNPPVILQFKNGKLIDS